MKKEKLTPVDFMKVCQKEGGLLWAGFESGLSLEDLNEDYEDFFESMCIIYDLYEQFNDMEKSILEQLKHDWSPYD